MCFLLSSKRSGRFALGKSEGFSKLSPAVVFAIALVASMAELAYAMRDLPVGTAYAVWVGIGAVLTVVYAMTTGAESVSVLKAAFLMTIVAGVSRTENRALTPGPRLGTSGVARLM